MRLLFALEYSTIEISGRSMKLAIRKLAQPTILCNCHISLVNRHWGRSPNERNELAKRPIGPGNFPLCTNMTPWPARLGLGVNWWAVLDSANASIMSISTAIKHPGSNPHCMQCMASKHTQIARDMHVVGAQFKRTHLRGFLRRL